MYRVSLEGLRMIDYCSGVKCFINYTLSNLRNSSRGGIRYPCKTCKNKKVSRSEYCNDASSIKIVNKKNTCVGLYTKNHMFLTRPWYKG